MPATLCRALRYASPDDNLLAASCQLTLTFCFIGGGYIWLYDNISATRMGFSSVTVIALPLVVVALATVSYTHLTLPTIYSV